MSVNENPLLGKKTEYHNQYNSSLIYPIARSEGRDKLGIRNSLFQGWDFWNCYELSFLNLQGKPIVCGAMMRYPSTSEFIVESKSLKLYLNSFNNMKLGGMEQFCEIVTTDLADSLKTKVEVLIVDRFLSQIHYDNFLCLDFIPIKDVQTHKYNPDYLKTESELVEENVYSHLLKSNCPVTDQPDWATIDISYVGPKINHEGLLRYILSFREHNEFHEQCVERIYWDIMKHCSPKKLTVFARYNRRGGIDINPYRSNFQNTESFNKAWRQ